MKKSHLYPLISVIVPVYNEEKYLHPCLKSLLSQSYPSLEIIMVDDGSTDDSRGIIVQYPVKLLRQNHLGLGPARNLGATEAKGEILVFADADMTFDRDYIKYLTQDIISGRVLGTFVIHEYVANPDNIWSRCWNINAGLPPHRRLPLDFGSTDAAFRAIKKDIFLKGGLLDNLGSYTDDATFGHRNNLLATVAPQAVCYHHNPESLSEVFVSTRWMGRSALFKKNLTNFLRYSPFNSIRVALKHLLAGAPLAIIPFKIVYDFGTLVGIFFSGKRVIK